MIRACSIIIFCFMTYFILSSIVLNASSGRSFLVYNTVYLATTHAQMCSTRVGGAATWCTLIGGRIMMFPFCL